MKCHPPCTVRPQTGSAGWLTLLAVAVPLGATTAIALPGVMGAPPAAAAGVSPYFGGDTASVQVPNTFFDRSGSCQATWDQPAGPLIGATCASVSSAIPRSFVAPAAAPSRGDVVVTFTIPSRSAPGAHVLTVCAAVSCPDTSSATVAVGARVPDVVHDTEQQAAGVLTRAGLRGVPPAGSQANDTVISQDPSAGAIVTAPAVTLGIRAQTSPAQEPTPPAKKTAGAATGGTSTGGTADKPRQLTTQQTAGILVVPAAVPIAAAVIAVAALGVAGVALIRLMRLRSRPGPPTQTPRVRIRRQRERVVAAPHRGPARPGLQIRTTCRSARFQTKELP